MQIKLQTVTQKYTENIDSEDPEYIALKEAYLQSFREHGFRLANREEYNQYSSPSL